MPRASFWCATSAALALLAPPESDAAVLLERRVEIEILNAGEVREEVSLRVLMESPGDVEAWSSYAIALDANRSLSHLQAAVETSDGQRKKARRRDQDRVERSGGGETYSSRYYRVVEAPGLRPGAVLELSYGIRSRPYYPARQIWLLGDEPTERLTVLVRGQGLSWELVGPAEGLEAEGVAGGVRVAGTRLVPVERSAASAAGSAVRPVLHVSWAGQPSWDDVGRWYAGLLRELPKRSPAVAARARSLTAGARSPRDRLEALLAFLRREVRYVAVEIGVGGYQPTPAPEVLERRWGDCKDKALLLVEMLRETGVPSYPALILASRRSRIDSGFPSPGQFNHVIVAVPADSLEVGPEDPVMGGYLFVDPTQTRGSARWLHPAVQDQQALVVTADGGELVRTPVNPWHEARLLEVDLEVSASGNAAGEAQLTLRGGAAVSYLDQMDSAPPEQIAEDILAVAGRLLPGYRLASPRWQGTDSEVPAFVIGLAVEGPRLVAAQGSLKLESVLGAPEPREVEGLGHPAAVATRVSKTVWRLALPEGWCPPEMKETRVSNPVGRFHQIVTRTADGRVQVERSTQILMHWIAPDDLPALRELSLSERRAAKRRVRFDCG